MVYMVLVGEVVKMMIFLRVFKRNRMKLKSVRGKVTSLVKLEILLAIQFVLLTINT